MKNRLKFLLVFLGILLSSLISYPFVVIGVFFAPRKLKRLVEKVYVGLVLFNWLQNSKNEI